MNPAQLLRQAVYAGYDLRVHNGSLRVKPPTPDAKVDLLPAIWADDRALTILVLIAQDRKYPPLCVVCGLLMSVVRVSTTCGRCQALHPLERLALQHGARRVYPRADDPIYDRWRSLQARRAA